MILCKLLVDYNRHRKDAFQYFDELEARILIRKGIAEILDGSEPEVPRNFVEVL